MASDSRSWGNLNPSARITCTVSCGGGGGEGGESQVVAERERAERVRAERRSRTIREMSRRGTGKKVQDRSWKTW